MSGAQIHLTYLSSPDCDLKSNSHASQEYEVLGPAQPTQDEQKAKRDQGSGGRDSGWKAEQLWWGKRMGVPLLGEMAFLMVESGSLPAQRM